MPDRSNTWAGGYVAKSGKHVIYKRVGGRLFELTTPATSARAAMLQLQRFEADPTAYRPEGDTREAALELTADLAKEFLVWSRRGKGNSPKWVRDQKRALAWWLDRLKGVDMRRASTARIVTELEPVRRGRKQLIATLKTFLAWLRVERHLLTTAQDPTFGQLRVPQSRPKQLEQVKAVGVEEYRRIIDALKGWPRDALGVLGATGWHWSELERFVKGGAVERHPRAEGAVLLCPHTKAGVPLRTHVPAVMAEPAERLRAAGASVEYHRFRRALRAVDAKFNPGFMRHSVASWAVNAGADPALVAAFLGHRSPATTRRFYATHAVPLSVPSLAAPSRKVDVVERLRDTRATARRALLLLGLGDVAGARVLLELLAGDAQTPEHADRLQVPRLDQSVKPAAGPSAEAE